MNIVDSAKVAITITMQAAEEIDNPLPSEYFSLLRRKMREGVVITRIGFGSEKEFEKIKASVRFNDANYIFCRSNANDYRRMLLVDNSKLMFAEKGVDGRHVFYTEDSGKIDEFKTYFRQHLTS